MGTFHQGKSHLDGITVVVDTTGDEIWVGRCDDEDDRRVILLDADVHTDGEGGKSKDEWVARAAQFGVWAKHRHVVLPREEVESITRLGEVEG
jgi:hypothetical protein